MVIVDYKLSEKGGKEDKYTLLKLLLSCQIVIFVIMQLRIKIRGGLFRQFFYEAEAEQQSGRNYFLPQQKLILPSSSFEAPVAKIIITQ